MTAGFTWQALNALAFFFKQVCGVADPVFNVKLRKTGARVPVVLSKNDVSRGLASQTVPGHFENQHSTIVTHQSGEI